MSKSLEQVRAELDSDIPRDVISQRDAGFGGKKLSYLEGWYVIDRLNKILGQGNWEYHLVELIKTFEGTVNDRFYVSYIAKVELSLRLPNQMGDTIFVDVGFGDGQDKNNPGKVHELAVKEAVTDGLKRCAKSLGMSMGLALYDKSQEFVSDSTKAKVEASPTSHSSPPLAPTPKSKALGTRELIEQSFKNLKALGKITPEHFTKTFVAPLGVAKVSELSDIEALKCLNSLKSTYPELGLN